MQDFKLEIEVKVIAKPITPNLGLDNAGPQERTLMVVSQKAVANYVGEKADIATMIGNALLPLTTGRALSAVVPPVMKATAATSIGAAAATFNGTVDPNGTSTAITFEYGLTRALGTSVAAAQSPSSSATPISVSYVKGSGLTANTRYYLRIKCVAHSVTTYSNIITFKTLAT